MRYPTTPLLGVFSCISLFSGFLAAQWKPPSEVSRNQILQDSKAVLAKPDLELKITEDIFRIEALGMQWDLGAAIYQPANAQEIAIGPDGKKIGVYLLHGGSGDHRGKNKIARLLSAKFGYKVVNMTYPGRLYLHSPSHDWPGDTVNLDGTVRTPIWNIDKPITPDQYEVVRDPSRLERYGTQTFACAKPGTEFYHRMAGWPVAFEEGGKDLLRRQLPEAEYSIYAHGHSTGGPFSFILSQSVPNIVGILGLENTPFGYIYVTMIGEPWESPFNCLKLLDWRHFARYQGPESLSTEGPEALNHLPRVMETVFARYERAKTSPLFKAEYIVHQGATKQLAEAAQAVAERLKLSPRETEAMTRRYVGYARERSGEGVKPVPTILFSLSKASPDHPIAKYRNIALPMFAAMEPSPKVDLVQFHAGFHGYSAPEEGLPMGIFPAVALLWDAAIREGFFRVTR